MSQPSSLGLTGNKNRVRAAPANGKKLVIKPLKSKPRLPEDFEAKTWARLQDAVQAVHQKRPVSCSLEELYRAVEDMCLHKMADRLYTNLQKECNAHIAREMAKLVQEAAVDAVTFLGQMLHVWGDHCSQMLTLRSIFLYLDRTYVISNSAVRSLFDMGLQLFRTHLQSFPEIGRKTVAGILRLIEAERQGTSVDRTLCHELLRMLSSLGIYESSFQEPFLEDSAAFYEAEGLSRLLSSDVPEYLLHCERRLAEEFERCQVYLDPGTRKPLILCVEKQLLERHMPAILERGFDSMVAQHRVEDLGRLYRLAARVKALDALKVAFKEGIKKSGLTLVLDEEKDPEMVQTLLKMKVLLDEIWERAFQRNEAYAHALKEAFEHFINQRANKPAELIAKFLDHELRSGNKGQSEEELDANLDRALLLFRYISGKDVFEAFYKKDLAKRLLLGRSASSDAEKAMITKLKAECGSQFTNKLEGMFKDIDLSHDVMTSFKHSAMVRAKVPAGVDMNVNVLTSGYWPSYPIIEATLPQELSGYSQVFKDFYLAKHSGRKLVWHNSLGTCVLRARFSKGVKELSVSLFQTIVLMLFNDADSLGFLEIKEASGIEDTELRRTLQSLALGKMRVLIKEPKGREVEDEDVFHFNAGFAAQLYRVKINTIQLKESAEENKKTNDQVLQDRQYQIDAAIVRIMKTRKTLSHKLLVSELMQMLKFPMKASDLKKRIESLIDREYLERDSENANVYIYLA